MKQSVILTEKVGRKVSDGTLHHSTPFICMPMLTSGGDLPYVGEMCVCPKNANRKF